MGGEGFGSHNYSFQFGSYLFQPGRQVDGRSDAGKVQAVPAANSAERGIEPEPASGEHSQEMAAGENQHVTLDRARAFHRAVCPRANLVRRFPSRAAITKQLPIRALPVDVSGKATLILAIVPFEQVTVDFSHSSKASQLAGPGGTLQRAGKHPGESHSTQSFLEPARIALAPFCERQVSKSRVLACDSPGGFPVSGQVNDRKHFAHRFTPIISRRSCAGTRSMTTECASAR